MEREAKTLVAASDHAGRDARMRLVARLREQGWDVDELGPFDAASVDYPDFAHRVGAAVAAGRYPVGLLLCHSGLGMSYAANRHPGVRAALCWSREAARLAREHNDANLVVLPAGLPTLDPLEAILDVFLATPFPGDERHRRRIAKIEIAAAGPSGAAANGCGTGRA